MGKAYISSATVNYCEQPFFFKKKKIKNYEIAILTMKLGNNLHLRCDYKI